MNRTTLVALADAALLAGCASGIPDREVTTGERFVPLGSLHATKGPSRNDGVTYVDLQSLYNDKIVGHGTGFKN